MKVKYIPSRIVNEPNNKINPMNIIRITLFILVAIMCMTWNRFIVGTNINGVGCSFCTVQQVARKLQKENFKEVSFTFITSTGETKTYQPSREIIKLFDLRMSNLEELKKIFEEQHQINFKRDFQITDYYNVNTDALKEYLSKIPEMQEKNQVMPQTK